MHVTLVDKSQKAHKMPRLANDASPIFRIYAKKLPSFCLNHSLLLRSHFFPFVFRLFILTLCLRGLRRLASRAAALHADFRTSHWKIPRKNHLLLPSRNLRLPAYPVFRTFCMSKSCRENHRSCSSIRNGNTKKSFYL